MIRRMLMAGVFSAVLVGFGCSDSDKAVAPKDQKPPPGMPSLGGGEGGKTKSKAPMEQ